MGARRRTPRAPRRRGSVAQEAWWASARFRAVGSAAARRGLQAIHNGPKCGARRKRDGQPCRQPALANGRCYIHGGATPRGRDWHVRQDPDWNAPDAARKAAAKAAKAERDDHRRRLRRAGLTPEQRAAHERWHASHKPGSAEKRASARSQRQAAGEVQMLLDGPQPEPSAEVLEVARDLEAVKLELSILNSMRQGGIFS